MDHGPLHSATAKRVERYESLFRQITPLFLLGLLGAVVLEPWLPGTAWLRQQFGETAVLRIAVAFLVGYVLLLWGESLRLHGILTGVLEAFRQFGRERATESGGAPGEAPVRNPRARLETARVLLAAMGSDDPTIRATSHHNLVRLVGRDLGAQPEAWREWLAEQERGS